MSELMYLDSPVATIEIRVSSAFVRILIVKEHNANKLPLIIRNKILNMQDWVIHRCMPNDIHQNIFFTEYFTQEDNRNPYAPFLLSLATNSITLSDKYWLNPHDNYTFQVGSRNIHFRKTTWEEINPFNFLLASEQINEFRFYENFLFSHCLATDANSLIWTTPGNKPKIWVANNNKYEMHKKSPLEECQNEILTFDFFKKNNIIVPKSYSSHHISVDADENLYNLNTIANGYWTIRKSCLTDESTYLVPLSHNIIIGDRDLHKAITQLCGKYSIEDEDIFKFNQAISDYIAEFSISTIGQIDTSNFGLLVNMNNEARPSVWSSLI